MIIVAIPIARITLATQLAAATQSPGLSNDLSKASTTVALITKAFLITVPTTVTLITMATPFAKLGLRLWPARAAIPIAPIALATPLAEDAANRRILLDEGVYNILPWTRTRNLPLLYHPPHRAASERVLVGCLKPARAISATTH
ncbi:hypothetical protein FN846DRAFT_889962 [Sphaerosporella brunnea]|uniref:Uncharacterized protein n=1 Tax=Sphaerosporella brunnea TaxID=1250544 RepID=A0A5J5EYW8_9PEZI|nr:hypothetical protein FN846DRAFT_889962 [Sphaerosporella brunnea]